MSQKIAAEDCPKEWSGPIAEKVAAAVVVREYEEERDKVGVERLEMRCEVTGQRSGPDNKKKGKNKKKKKKAFLVTDLLGDPLCRVRSFPLHVMLVAEWGEGGEIVGVIRGCIKRVKIRGNTNPSSSSSSSSSDYVKAANVLGLRVSPSHRFPPPPSFFFDDNDDGSFGGMHVRCFLVVLNMRLMSRCSLLCRRNHELSRS